MADLSLELFEASNFTLGSSLQQSDSPVDNVEHLYLQHLDPGQYAIRVSGAAGTDFALAWSGTDYGMIGDLNLDGVVDGDDSAAFIAGWGSGQATGNLDTWCAGDINQDGMTDLADFLLMRVALNSLADGDASLVTLFAGSSVAVPEPANLISSVLAVVGLIALRRNATR